MVYFIYDNNSQEDLQIKERNNTYIWVAAIILCCSLFAHFLIYIISDELEEQIIDIEKEKKDLEEKAKKIKEGTGDEQKKAEDLKKIQQQTAELEAQAIKLQQIKEENERKAKQEVEEKARKQAESTKGADPGGIQIMSGPIPASYSLENIMKHKGAALPNHKGQIRNNGKYQIAVVGLEQYTKNGVVTLPSGWSVIRDPVVQGIDKDFLWDTITTVNEYARVSVGDTFNMSGNGYPNTRRVIIQGKPWEFGDTAIIAGI